METTVALSSDDPMRFDLMETPVALSSHDPWRFDLDLDMAEVSWFYYDGENKAKAARLEQKSQLRWEEWERLEVLKQKEKVDEVLRKKKSEGEKEKEQKQTEPEWTHFKRARTCALRRSQLQPQPAD